MILDFCISYRYEFIGSGSVRRCLVKYLVVGVFSFLPAVALAQTAQQLQSLTAQQQAVARVNGDRELAETALRHYEESVVLNDQSRQAEIAALTDQLQWWKDCTGEKIAGCREWVMSMSPTK
jgi:hypothetical protein